MQKDSHHTITQEAQEKQEKQEADKPEAAAYIPIRLRCEYQERPLAIDTPYPRFSWEFPEMTESGFSQSAWRIQLFMEANNTLEALDSGEEKREPLIRERKWVLQWDSGKASGSKPFEIPYEGPALRSFSVYRWQVCIWDQKGRMSRFSEPAEFETAALHAEELSASWISHPCPISYEAGEWESGTPGEKTDRAKSVHYYGIYLSGVFQLNQERKEIHRARAYISGAGTCSLYVNGTEVGENLLSPAQTDFTKRILYEAYDLNPYLLIPYEPGRTVECSLVLGNGRHIALYGFGKPRGFLQLLIEYRDGTRQWFKTDASWKAGHGPMKENSIFNGESCDGRLAFPLQTPQTQASHGFTDSSAYQAEVVTGYPLQSASIPPITVEKRIQPLRFWKTPQGYLFDFGVNFSGTAELSVLQPKGTELRLMHAENITEEGQLNPASNRSAMAADRYICAGTGIERWHARMTYHGFRYLLLQNYVGVPDLHTVTGLFFHTQVDHEGEFTCSNEDFNAIHQAVKQGQLSNMMGIPTDSPQRDERHGWLGDAHLSAVEALLNFGPVRFYEKFIQDMEDTQRKDGSITDTAPKFWMSKPADPAWGTAFISIGWYLYWYKGDIRVLETYFPSYERYMSFLGSCLKDGVIQGLGTFGDWCAPGLVTSLKTGLEFISTWYYLHDISLMVKIAEVLGYADRAEYYRSTFQATAGTFLERYWVDDHFESRVLSPWDHPDQTSQALGLALEELLPREKKAVLAAYLHDLIGHDAGDHISTGIHGTRYILEALSATGYQEKAYIMADQRSYPGWRYMIEEGATTLWERWEHITSEGMNSHNHIMLGSIDGWFYQNIAGISPKKAGWEAIDLRPGVFSDIVYAKGKVKTPFGYASLSWERAEGKLCISLLLPPGTAGELQLPTDYHFTDGKPGEVFDGAAEGTSNSCTLASGFYQLTAECRPDSEVQEESEL